MSDVDRLCVSPKPPSSGQKYEWSEVQKFLTAGLLAKTGGVKGYEWMFLKIVIFNEGDLDFAEMVRRQLSDALLYLSTGNDSGRTVGNPDRQDPRDTEQIRSDLLTSSKWLVEQVFERPKLCTPDVIIQSQYHVLLWGNQKGR